MDVRTQPLIAQQGNIRVDPYAQPSSDPNALPPSVAKSAGMGVANAPNAVDPQVVAAADVNQDGELDEQEVASLHEAAAAGDGEANKLLIALGLTGGMAATGAALYATNRRRIEQLALPAPSPTQVQGPQKLLANPVKKLTGPATQKALSAPLLALADPTPRKAPTSATISHPEEDVKDFPGSKLRKAASSAAKAARRMH